MKVGGFSMTKHTKQRKSHHPAGKLDIKQNDKAFHPQDTQTKKPLINPHKQDSTPHTKHQPPQATHAGTRSSPNHGGRGK